MKATYITSVTARINPFVPHSKVPRLVLALLPSNAHRTMQIKTTQLPRTSMIPALLELGFKDGKSMKWEWTGVCEKVGGKIQGEASVQDIVGEVERHARVLGRKEELSG